HAWRTPRRTGLWGPRACHAPGGAGPPAVWTVSGAAAATAGAALAHTPSALSQALGEAAGATAAPARPATRAGVPRPPGPGGLARGAGPSCRRDGRAPARGPGAPRPAPRGPPRAPWPH